VADALLTPHRSYLPVVRPLLEARLVKGMAHVTGGGITDNLPRVLPDGIGAVVRRAAWEVPAIFRILGEAGRVPGEDLMRTFNMGIGLIAVVAPGDVDRTLDALRRAGEPGARVIGEAEPGECCVRYEP
jgi:phosphoribosylformylglycinamidine cyclo-ligase